MAIRADPRVPVRLSAREREVAQLVADGLTNREIGERLFISERTVDSHLEHIREKLGTSSRTQIALWVARQANVPTTEPQVRRQSAKNGALAVIASIAVVAIAAVAYSEFLLPSGPTMRTIAGGGTPGGTFVGRDSGDNQPAVEAGLYHPLGVAVDGDVIYVCESQAGLLRRIDSKRFITTVVGGGTEPFRDGINPTSVQLSGGVAFAAVAGDGSIYLTAVGNGSLQLFRFDADSSLHLIPRPSRAGIWHPFGIAIDPTDGALYVSTWNGNSIWRLDRNGSFTPYAGTGNEGFAGDGLAAVSAELDYPAGLAVDAHRNLYIADLGNNRIRRVDFATGLITTVAGNDDIYGFSGDGGPAIRARLALPVGVAVDRSGRIYIADTDNNRIRMVGVDGVIHTIAGTSRAGFSGDAGPAAATLLDGPEGLAIDAHGNLLVADSSNNRLRLIGLKGQGG